MKDLKYLRNRELILGVILLVLGWPLGFYNPFELIAKIGRLLLDLFQLLISFLNMQIPMWSTLASLIIFALSNKLWVHHKQKKRVDNNFLEYREDVFNDVKYRWRYSRVKKQYTIVDVRAYCSNCGCHLPVIECPNPDCKKVYLEKPMGDHVAPKLTALIRHKLSTIYKIDEYERIK